MKQFVETVGIGKILLYFIIINVIGFLAMAIDKWKDVFRHKTKKPKFTIGMPVILVLEIILVIYELIKM